MFSVWLFPLNLKTKVKTCNRSNSFKTILIDILFPVSLHYINSLHKKYQNILINIHKKLKKILHMWIFYFHKRHKITNKKIMFFGVTWYEKLKHSLTVFNVYNVFEINTIIKKKYNFPWMLLVSPFLMISPYQLYFFNSSWVPY